VVETCGISSPESDTIIVGLAKNVKNIWGVQLKKTRKVLRDV
jgi:hypothetical protein